MHVRNIPQNTPEWLAMRNGIEINNGVVVKYHGGTIGASKAASVLNWSPYVDARTVYRADIGDIPAPILGAPPGVFCPLRHGHETEDVTMFAYAVAVSTLPIGGGGVVSRIRRARKKAAHPFPSVLPRFVRIKPTGMYYTPEAPYMHASVDGLVLTVTSGGATIATSAEAKSPVYGVYESIPVTYLIQMMHQKFVVVKSFFDEFTCMLADIREELGEHPHLLPQFEKFAQTLTGDKDKKFARALFEGARRAALNGLPFTASDVVDIDGSDIEFMACWWANERKDKHSYAGCEAVCAHLRVWRIKYNHEFACLVRDRLHEYVSAVNTDPPNVNDPRVMSGGRARFGGSDSAYVFKVARVVEGMVTSESLAVERNANEARPCFDPDVSFPFHEHLEAQKYVRCEDGSPALISSPSKVPRDSIMHVKWFDENDFAPLTIEEIDSGHTSIKMSQPRIKTK